MTAAPVDFEFAVRPLGAADAMVVAALHHATLDESWSAKSIVDIVTLPSIGGHLAIAGPAAMPAPIGFILLMHAADQAEIVAVGVLPAWRRRGVGRGLLAAAIQAARARGAATLFLEVAADNPAARQLYATQGFRPVGTRAGYYVRPDGSRQDALVLRSDL